jgi:hypothetical protein
MDSDLFLVLGLIIGGLAFPSLLGAYSEGRPPRTAALLIIIAAGLIVAAVMTKPSGYTFMEVPQAFVRVIGRVVN